MTWPNPFQPGPATCLLLLKTALHFLWQGTLVAALVWAAEPALARLTAAVKYRLLLAALVVMVACPFATLWVNSAGSAESRAASASMTTPTIDVPDKRATVAIGARTDRPAQAAEAVRPTPPPVTSTANVLRQLAPGATAAYALGVALMLLRLVFASVSAKSLAKDAAEVDATVYDRARRVATRLRMRAVPPVRFCARI